MFEQFAAFVAHLRSAWRFRWQGMLMMWLCALAGWAIVFVIPNQYESSARVFVDTNTMLRPLLEGIAVSANTGNQVDLVRRALLSRQQLERVIEETELHRRVSGAREREDLLRDLAIDIQIRADVSSPAAREANIFTLSYRDQERDLAYAVVKGLLDAFVTQSVGANRTDAEAAQDLLRSQLAEYEKRLTESEARLAEFKKQNVGAMPDERGGYFQRVQTETIALDQLQANLAVAQQRRTELRGRLLGDGSPGESSSALETSVDARLRAETARLDEMLLRFTDQHPDVVAVRETIARLERQRQDELAALRSDSAALGRPTQSTNLVMQNLQIALNQAETDIASLQAQVRDRQQRVAALRDQINTLPGVEAELLRLNRDYDVTRTEYERLLQRLEAARLSDAADRVDEVRFNVIDPPVKAVLPVAPRRALLLFAVTVVSLGVGFVLAWFLGQIHPVFLRAVDLEKFKDVRTLGIISDVSPALGAVWQSRAILAGSVCALLGAAVVLIKVRPVVEAVFGNLLGRGLP